MDWRQTYRGIVRHVIPQVRERGIRHPGHGPVRRDSVYLQGWKAPGGTCLWCGREAPTRRHRWHSRCAKFYLHFRGHPASPPGPARCRMCGGDEHCEVDHKLAIGVARPASSGGTAA